MREEGGYDSVPIANRIAGSLKGGNNRPSSQEAFCFCFLADFMRVSPMKVATTATRKMTSTVGIAMAYFRGRKKSCAGCDVSTKG